MFKLFKKQFHVNISIIFYKNNYIIQSTIFSDKSDILFLQISLMSGLREDLAEFLHLLLLSLLQYIVLVEGHEENPASHDGNWKSKGILIVFRIIVDILDPTPKLDKEPMASFSMVRTLACGPEGSQIRFPVKGSTSVAGSIPCISVHQ